MHAPCPVQRGYVYSMPCAVWTRLLHVLCSMDVSAPCPLQHGCICSMPCAAWTSVLHVLCSVDASAPCPMQHGGGCPVVGFHINPGSLEVVRKSHAPPTPSTMSTALCFACVGSVVEGLSGLIICIIFQPCVPLLSGRLWASVDIKPKWKSECLIWWWQFHSWKLC